MNRTAATILAAAMLFSTSAFAVDSSAELFIQQAYAPWINPALKRISDTELMSAEFMKLWQADDKAADKVGEVGIIDGNLICACQDGQMSGLNIVVRPINATRATARATFDIDGISRDQLLLLKREGGSWFIDDIITKHNSLKAQLREDARMRQHRPAKATN